MKIKPMSTAIKGIEGMTLQDINEEVERGGRFVLYTYVVSILVMTFKQPTDIYFVRGAESRVGKGLAYTLVTLLAGWWGIPWGPIYSIGTIFTNLSGGKDLTTEVLHDLLAQARAADGTVAQETTVDAEAVAAQ